MSIPSWCRVGAKCVRVPWQRPVGWPERVNDLGYRWIPEVGHRFTISRVWTDDLYGVFVALQECPHGTRLGFPAAAFRPLIDDSEEALQRDVALIKAHLKPPKVYAREERDRLTIASGEGRDG